ncbi:hypothetical protein JD974_12305 [Chromobacterium haemolyticum]|uniref:Uncharacterized protein n=1 Tax=Chromobacterium haemolyticum TaxID=394935 RepID=A0ABS3GNG4_9NEIS|nr:hypothetical protein [Chromobacterium haemolyticum]MBK0415187.1 hypothetical protein [Chromobacterium haemolyticum]MBO0416598.1 hypothetical protein [Chromobacterium haemolyticum]MBO0499826.1 hypothetical protein [Chromobacterium haemolyticum]QOD84868.1 hypothetical protein IEZ30_10475 [Chromobacterium haemolyticum]
MKKSKITTLDNKRDVHCRELTVAEIRALFEYAPADQVDAFLLPGISLTELAAMTDLSLEEMAALPPSQLEKVLADCREVNSYFFDMQARLEKLLAAARS